MPCPADRCCTASPKAARLFPNGHPAALRPFDGFLCWGGASHRYWSCRCGWGFCDCHARNASSAALGNAAEVLTQTDDKVKAGARGVQNIINSEGIRTVTFTGHSLGGTIAELLACRLHGRLSVPVEAVTLKSPGCSDLVGLLEGYQHDGYGFIATFSSSPVLCTRPSMMASAIEATISA